ncbi:MAG: hypothetical protein HYX69_00420 [Planctomycetia bacterium]|nr:hypothetical protein [Planctomycetia bacterium]
MRIGLGTYSSEDYNADCDYALVDLTPALAKRILARMDLAARLHRDDISLHELYFWNAEAEFFSTPDDALTEQLPDASDGHVILPEGLEIPADCFQRTEYDHMIVNTVGEECEVFWRSSPKNVFIEITTASLPRELIEQIARGLQPSSRP